MPASLEAAPKSSPRDRIRVAIPAPSRVMVRWFAWYARRYVARHFHGLRVSGSIPSGRGGPVIVYLNHPSWWDPLICIILAREFFPNQIHYGPIDRSGLTRYPILRRLGFFGIEPQTRRGAIEFLRTSEAILSDPNAVLWVTAEGSFTDPRQRPTMLRPGVAHLARRLADATIIPLALEYPFWQERTAEALVRFGEPILAETQNGEKAADWNDLLQCRLEAAQDELARDAMTRDASRFRTIVGGQTGVGGIYDLWRQTKALLTGKPFTAGHAE